MEVADIPYESISLWLPLPYRVLLLFIVGKLSRPRQTTLPFSNTT
jgi:hypothetical protein